MDVIELISRPDSGKTALARKGLPAVRPHYQSGYLLRALAARGPPVPVGSRAYLESPYLEDYITIKTGELFGAGLDQDPALLEAIALILMDREPQMAQKYLG
ncbi:hypothetical protein [Marinobacter bryozoorum]|uniref:hypothetical protein n=1 Tax=Marinobacter bryozoorum TaxID=256324 RepID=UPI002003A17F|nr:hypothetical protein [Marinobacter bryozoorum]